MFFKSTGKRANNENNVNIYMTKENEPRVFPNRSVAVITRLSR